jgi:hypothetical protein
MNWGKLIVGDYVETKNIYFIEIEVGKGWPVRPREAPPFKAGKKARLRVNLEQAPAFRPGSRKVHLNFLMDRRHKEWGRVTLIKIIWPI